MTTLRDPAPLAAQQLLSHFGHISAISGAAPNLFQPGEQHWEQGQLYQPSTAGLRAGLCAVPGSLRAVFSSLPPLQSYCSDPSLVLDLKNLIVLFADTLQVPGWGSPAAPALLCCLSWAWPSSSWDISGPGDSLLCSVQGAAPGPGDSLVRSVQDAARPSPCAAQGARPLGGSAAPGVMPGGIWALIKTENIPSAWWGSIPSPPALQGYGFPVNQLFEMLLEIQDQYSETLLKKWAGVFR